MRSSAMTASRLPRTATTSRISRRFAGRSSDGTPLPRSVRRSESFACSRSPAHLVGLPHRLIEDDVYEEYFFPKGTLVVVNIWYARPHAVSLARAARR